MVGNAGLMNEDLLVVVVRESVSLFVLLIVLIGSYRLLDRLINIFDKHLGAIENDLNEFIRLFRESLGN